MCTVVSYTVLCSEISNKCQNLIYGETIIWNMALFIWPIYLQYIYQYLFWNCFLQVSEDIRILIATSVTYTSINFWWNQPMIIISFLPWNLYFLKQMVLYSLFFYQLRTRLHENYYEKILAKINGSDVNNWAISNCQEGTKEDKAVHSWKAWPKIQQTKIAVTKI